VRVVATTPVWTLNGVNTFLANLVRGARGSGVSIRLVSTGVTYPDCKPMPLPADLALEQLPLPALATWPARWRSLVAYLEAQAPCLYLPNHDVSHSGVSAVLSSRVGIIGIAHSDDAQHYDHVARLGRYWNAVVGVSARIAERLRQSGAVSPARVSVIPYGVPVAAGTRAAVRERGPLRILYCGRLEQRQKRVLDLPEIALGLVRRGVDFEMTIAGDGPARVSLERRVAGLGLAGRVRLTGTITNDEVLALCGWHDVFLLPSAFEGLPVGVLEAMGQGCIPVVSDVASGIPDLIRDGVNGYRVPVGQMAMFVECLASLAGSVVVRRRMAEGARRTICTGGYRVDDMTARYLALFESVWAEVREGRFVRPAGLVSAPPQFTWRDRLQAPLWPVRCRWVGGS
jgi:glycosyltransferase involved in cell wall biosynthesis